MDTRTGKLIDELLVERLSRDQRQHFVPVVRDLTQHERTAKQIALYAPCACGSGKKFKFCCKRPA